MRTDADLVRAGTAGDRQAFGEIVERYQSLVCAIAYSGTGDVALSQDLAQETFLAAWTDLAALRDPAKLKAWLAGIARNLTKNARRRHRDTDALEAAADARSPLPSPLEEVLDREQQGLLWRALQEIPESYREPLVLFYREGGSVERVASSLELSPDAVKQRLARGRQMLKQQVAELVESALARTRPGRAFTIAVLAALPAAAPQVAAAAVAASAAQGSGSAQAAAPVALSGVLLGPLLGVAGAFIGVKASLDATRSARERAFVVRSILLFTAFALAFAAVELAGLIFWPAVFGTLPVQLAVIALYTAGLLTMIVRHNRAQRRIQVQEGTFVAPDALSGPELMDPPPSAIYGSFGGTLFGGTLWMVPMSLIAGETAFAVAILAATSLLFVVSTQVVLRRPTRFFPAMMAALAALGLLNLGAVNLRWEAWMGAYRRHWTYEPLADLPLWVMNVGLVLLFGGMLLGTYRQERRRSTSASRS